MPTPQDWFAAQDRTPAAPSSGRDWFAAQDSGASTESDNGEISVFHPLEDIGNFARGIGRFASGVVEGLAKGPARVAQEMAIDYANKLAVDQATGQGSGAGHAIVEGAKALSPVPIAPLVTTAQAIGYGTHLTDTPVSPREAAEAIGELTPVVAAAAAHGIETTPDTGTTFGVKRPSVSSVLPKEMEPRLLMHRSLKSNGWILDPRMADRALRQVKAIEVERGTPAKDFGELEQDANTAKQRVWSQYEQLVGPQQAMGATIDGNAIADKMIESIPERTRVQSPALARRIEQKAATYRRPVPVQQAEDFLQQGNAELEGYFGENPALRASARQHPQTAAVVAETDALRDLLYKKLDEPGGGTAARELKRDYGALSKLQTDAMKRKIQVSKAEPDTVTSAITRAMKIGSMATSVPLALMGHPEAAMLDLAGGYGGHLIAEWMKAQTSPEGLMRRAMRQQKELPTPVEMPARPVVRGLLSPGAIRLPEAPDTSPITQRGEWAVPLREGEVVPEPAVPVARQPAQLPAGRGVNPAEHIKTQITEPEWMPRVRALLSRGNIPLGKATRSGRPVSPTESGPFYLPANEVFERMQAVAPDEWEIMREQPKAGQLSDIELRELERIHEELGAMQFQKRFSTDTGAYGQKEWHAGSAGAPVYDDILEAPDPVGFEKPSGVGKPSRANVAADIFTALKGGRISRVAAKAIMVARARAVGGYPEGNPLMRGRLSKPKLPPWWEN